MLSSKLISGLLLLARLYPNSKAETTDYGVEFIIWNKDRYEISKEDTQVLENWGWRFTKYEGLDTWDW